MPGPTASAAVGTPGHARCGSARPGIPLPPGHAWTVTLITGDIVQVQTVCGGPPRVTVRPRPGRGDVIISQFVSASGQIEVLPADVVPLLGRVLDPALFDVTTLIQDGDSDGCSLPLIVAGRPGQIGRAMAAAGLVLKQGNRPSPPGTVAVDEPGTGAARTGRALDAMSAAILRAGRVIPQATWGIRHIWLARNGRAVHGAVAGAAADRVKSGRTVALTLKATPIPGTASGKMGAWAYVVNIGNPALFDQEVPIPGHATVQVPAGHYWISGVINDDTNLSIPRAAWAGQPEATVTSNTTVVLNGADTVPVTGSVTGHPTVMTSVGFHVERRFTGHIFGGLLGGDVFAFGPNVSHDLFAQPTGTVRTGTFNVYTDFQLASPAGTAHPYVYDLYHPVGPQVPRSLAYIATPAEQATFARFDQRLYAVDGNTAPMQEIRYGLTPTSSDSSGFPTMTVEDLSTAAGGSTLTQYLSTGPGISWSDEAAPPLAGPSLANDWVIIAPGFTRYAPGSQHTVDWAQQPFRPGPYSDTVLSGSGCAPHPTVRTHGTIHVELVDLQDRPDGFDCLGGPNPLPEWQSATSRTMHLYQGSHLLGTSHLSVGDFPVPAAPDTYKLVYTDDTSRALPVSTQTSTTWTFRSAAPAGGTTARIPLLLVDYALPLGLDNHPDGSTAVFTVTRVAGTPRARVTGFRLWISLDNGHTWQPAQVRTLPGGRFSATMPHAATGQSVSLRVQTADAGGSGIEQTIMTAYHG